MIRPARLRDGAGIALVAPAGPLPPGALERAVEQVEAWGWRPLPGPHAAGSHHGYLSGRDEDRLGDLQAALSSPAVDAVWCLRGGYGTMRLLRRIDWRPMLERPRPLIGFSDNTALHLALVRRGLVSFHGPHAAADPFPPFTGERLRELLVRPEPAGVLPLPEESGERPAAIRGGAAEGPLVGGNLALLAATLGTPDALRAEGAILFFEEVGEPAYRIDRLLTQLELAGVLDAVAGVVIGGMTEVPIPTRDDIPPVREVLAGRLHDRGVPVLTGCPVGHIDEMWTLPLGIRARLDADAGTLELLEAAVR